MAAPIGAPLAVAPRGNNVVRQRLRAALRCANERAPLWNLNRVFLRPPLNPSRLAISAAIFSHMMLRILHWSLVMPCCLQKSSICVFMKLSLGAPSVISTQNRIA